MLYPWLESYYQQFLQSAQHGRQPSSIIIAGSPGLGVNALALEIVKYYLCHNKQPHGYCGECPSCQSFRTFTHQDLKVAYAANADDARLGRDFSSDCSALLTQLSNDAKSSVRVDTMRKTTDFLNESAVMGGGKAVIICSADSMTESAANAILKTFEEPLPNTLIVMLSKSLESLLPTILSRASKMVIRDVEQDLALQYILNPENQVPQIAISADLIDPDLHYDERQALYHELVQEETAKCEGLKTPIDKKRAEVALALNSRAPLDAMNMLLHGEDMQALQVVELFVANLKSRQEDDMEVIYALQKLSPLMRSRLLYELILETLKFKARVPVASLPLIYYTNAEELQYLQADHLFDACNKLKFIEERAPLFPAMAPVALLRSWLIGLKRRNTK